MSAMDDLTIPRWWLYGRPADLWFQYADVIEAFVKDMKIKPVLADQLPTQGFMSALAEPVPSQGVKPASAPQGSEALAFRPPRFNGGMRVPHLHLGDKVYKLTSEQWKDFSGKVMKGFATKLAEARTVSLPRLLELSSAIDSMA